VQQFYFIICFFKPHQLYVNVMKNHLTLIRIALVRQLIICKLSTKS